MRSISTPSPLTRIIPTNGSTAPGYSLAEVDAIVAETRTNGLYLIITIGNGANNGNYNRA